MIEVVSSGRCTACNICVAVCPTNVFEAVADAPPVIARGADCQTCFMCELYCPEDALYVAPDADHATVVSEAHLAAGNVLGSYRAAIGWAKGTQDRKHIDAMHRLLKTL